jgi:hypothetical protein
VFSEKAKNLADPLEQKYLPYSASEASIITHSIVVSKDISFKRYETISSTASQRIFA